MGKSISKTFQVKPSHKDETRQEHRKISSPNKASNTSAQSGLLGKNFKVSEKSNFKRKKFHERDSSDIESFDLNSCFVGVDKLEALEHAALRLKSILNTVNVGQTVQSETLNKNLDYCIAVIEAALSKIIKLDTYGTSEERIVRPTISGTSPVHEEIKSWIEETFTKKRGNVVARKGKRIKRNFRAVVRVVQASLVFDRFIINSSTDLLQNSFSSQVLIILQSIDKWQFNVFELESQISGELIKSILCKLFLQYDFLRKFKIPPKVLCKFATKIQKGYGKYSNRYHNSIHAADVTQTTHCLLHESGLITWLSDVEIFAMLIGAVVHDVEHTGTTNTFHINTRSNLALLYNDRSVLEQHHVSAAFRVMQDQECDIMRNFTKEEYHDCRTLIIEMVLSTDMSHHFDHIKQIEMGLECPRWLERSKAMSLLIHAADLNNPAKPWKIHYLWTQRLMFEYFAQGDKEKELDLPISPLCDRENSKVAQSQIGFIQYIIIPTFTTLFSIFSEVIALRQNEELPIKAQETIQKNILKSTFCDFQSEEVFDSLQAASVRRKMSDLKDNCFSCISFNNDEWCKRDKVEQELNLLGEQAFLEYPSTAGSTSTPESDPTIKRQHREGSLKSKPHQSPSNK